MLHLARSGPGALWNDPQNGDRDTTRDRFADPWRVHTVQKDGPVLALYQSKAQFRDHYSVLRLVIVVPVFYRDLRRITIGESSGSTHANPAIVWMEDEYPYAAIRPLI
jgi:hypothetical protein